jgi:Asp-tRNA(Asn)/Glu-tRNA(Gln) amidotransferase A subunit family amidase
MPDTELAESRRRFLAYFSSAGLTSTLLPGVLWEKLQAQSAAGPVRAAGKLTAAMVRDALSVAGVEFSDDETQAIVAGANQSLERYVERRSFAIDPTVPPSVYFSPLVPGTRLDRELKPFRMSKVTALRRPGRLEDLAYLPVLHLAHLLKTRQVKSVELTEMYLARLAKYGPALNCVVTLTTELALAQATQADREIAAGHYRGPLHGIPWGCKDIISVPGYPTTWGVPGWKTRVIEVEATVPRLLREAGAVLVAKLATGEMAGGEYWFGGRINNPWDLSEGASGSSGGPAGATASGLVAFAIGTDTGGSILFPATRCGATGLRPTFGRVSRHGAMALSWTRDRLGPICRTAEDCALVFKAIAKPDEYDPTVIDLPFNWDAGLDVRTLRVGYLEPTGAEEGRSEEWRANDQRALEQLRALGVKLEPFTMPALPMSLAGGAGAAESGASFEDLLFEGQEVELINPNRRGGLRSGRLVPAVEYLQASRIRSMVMRTFAATAAKFDVYVASSNNPILNPPGARSGGGGVVPNNGPNRTRDEHDVSNTCGIPAVVVPNGFTSNGKPTSLTFHGRLYNESGVLALAKAYQDATSWHLKHPPLQAAGAQSADGV